MSTLSLNSLVFYFFQRVGNLDGLRIQKIISSVFIGKRHHLKSLTNRLSCSLCIYMHSYSYSCCSLINNPFETTSSKPSIFLCHSSRIFRLCSLFKVWPPRLVFYQTISDSMNSTSCESADLEACRDESAAFILKFVAIASILVAGAIGVAIPLVGRQRRFLQTDGSLFFALKAFAAGVILATGFVHMLPSGSHALSSSCLPENPWTKFPFSGFFAMMAALATLLVDFLGTQYYERKQGLNRTSEERVRVGSEDTNLESVIVPVQGKEGKGEKVFGEEESGGMHIVGMRAHAAHHRHNHPHERGACAGQVSEQVGAQGHGHSHGFGDGEEDAVVRHVVVSQILELGIVSHSVIIGLSLGVSQSPCTIRPLIAALSFHQFFEGFALGGCISQAQFNNFSSTVMACFFAITTPLGIGIGTCVSSFYNPYSPGALVAEGILDSLSAGILVYMALVDLIAADFLSKRMSSNFRLQVVSYLMLFLGAGMMSTLAIWA